MMEPIETWPVHPRPESDETLSSWLLRSARANASTLSSWLAAMGGDYGDVRSLDTTEIPRLWEAATLGAMLGEVGEQVIRQMTFLDVAKRLGPRGAGRWILSLDERVRRPKHAFCAACLAADARPYLRRLWRLEWARWCPTHQCRLQRGCPKCGATLLPWRRSWEETFTSCWQCNQNVTRETKPNEPAPPFVMEAIRQCATYALDDADIASAAAVFEKLWSLQKWAEAVGPECWPSWVMALDVGTAIDATPPLSDDAPVWSMALAWHLSRDPKTLASLARRHQSTFNRATAFHCPPELSRYRATIRRKRKVSAEQVEQAVTTLIESDMPLTYLAVAERLGVSPMSIGGNPAMRAVVDRMAPVALARWCDSMRAKLRDSRERLHVARRRVSRANLAADIGVSLEAIARFERETGETFAVSPRQEYESIVREAITALRAKSEPVTSTAVARQLGRERSFIEKHPDLKLIVQAARDAKPTPDEVRRACLELRSQDEAVTILGVARLLGRGREVIERTKLLRAVVDAERVVDREAIEAKVRQAAEELAARQVPVTVGSVCHRLGRHRSYIEKRGPLRAIVERARARVESA